MAEPGCGAQFQAAVRVIQGLPRSGSYRPSYEEMLRFYSYYKQATAGRCQGPRPGFWDPIGRYKWDAWHSLGRMSKEEAMAAYVAEMKKVAQKIIDTVSPDETTQEMFRYFEPLYEVIRDMPRPPESFFRGTGDEQEQEAESGQEERASSPALEDALPGEQQDRQQAPDVQLGGAEHGAGSPAEPTAVEQRPLPELDARVAGTVRALQDDMQRVLERLNELELLTSTQAASPWALPASPHTLLFLVAWPFITQWLLRRWRGRKR
ncbi:hypothetical protein ASZ78_003949 [Callipepla squamata]|uniref:ACB domain-containing protein n=1 Tax=Callipepla squamata TaxID=9009 RepID=A0A226MN30_CALSU|nr:hypothetical protein ASZ78_003949 [Callipepla squamata]